jgi:hypothetical protein
MPKLWYNRKYDAFCAKTRRQKREVNNTSLLVNIRDRWLNLFLSVDGLLKKCFGKKLACIFILVTVKLGKLLQTPLLSSF